MARNLHGLKRVSDVRPSFGEGQRYLKFEEVEGEDFILLGFRTLSTQHGTAVVIQIERNGERDEILTWSQVVLGQLRDIEDQLPLIGTVTKHGRYYSLS